MSVSDKMCSFCYEYEIELVGEGFLAVINKPVAAMVHVKCKCKCEEGSLRQVEGNSKCAKCEHYVIGRKKVERTGHG